jgi:hypothetical protein
MEKHIIIFGCTKSSQGDSLPQNFQERGMQTILLIFHKLTPNSLSLLMGQLS